MREIKTVQQFATVVKLDEGECRPVLRALGALTETGRRVFSRQEIDAILADAITPPAVAKISEAIKR